MDYEKERVKFEKESKSKRAVLPRAKREIFARTSVTVDCQTECVCLR